MNRIHFLNQLATSECPYNFGAGVPPLDQYPAFDPGHFYRLFLEEFPNQPVLHYHQSEGFLGEMSQQVFQQDGFSEAKCGIITNGVQESITVTALLFKNACVACTDPFYPGFVDAVKMSGNKPFFIDGEHWLESLESLNPGSLFYLSADFANPTGKRLTLSERQRLIEIARRRDFYIFDDATYRPFYLDAALPSLVSLAPERVFHALSFSKLLSPGLRIAMTHVPDTMLAAFAALKANISLNSSGFTQAIVGGWLFQNGFSLSAHLAEFKEKMNNKKQFLQNQGLDYEGGFFAAMEIKGRILDFEWCSKLLEIEGVAVCPMNLFSDTSLFNHKIRIAVAKTSEKNLEEGFMKIHKFAQS